MPKITKKTNRKCLVKKAKKDKVCSICFENMGTTELKRPCKLYNDSNISCDHSFCYGCIRNWVKTGEKSCPLCRMQFVNVASSHNKLIIIDNKISNVRTIFTFLNELANNEYLKKTFMKGLADKCQFQVMMFQQCLREMLDVGITTFKIKSIMQEMEETVQKSNEQEIEYFIQHDPDKDNMMDFFMSVVE